MCGIVGCYRPGGATAADADHAARATATLRHRGPDGIGAWSDGPVALGHARLSIIDLATGHQPLHNEDGRIAVILNGEIYNYQDLRRELIALGHRFRSQADTEVIVHGYEAWGDRVTDRLDGMFAFALWDGHRQRLLLARDRFGEKPLYHTTLPGDPGVVWFASEIKALVDHPGVPRALDAANLEEYLLYRHVLAPGTLFAGVRQLPAGHAMVIADGEVTVRQWYDETAAPGPGVPADAGAGLLEASIERRLMSDVALGTVLSGGIDSTLVSAIAARHRPGLDTFCVGFEDPTLDERPYARAVATMIGSRHHELVIAADDILGELRQLTWANDEPLTHPNSIAMHLIFRFAKLERGVTVLLSGEGADEVFGGYDWYRVLARRSRLFDWPGARAAAGLVPGERGRTLRRLADPEYPLLANAFSRPGEVAGLVGRTPAVPASRRRAWPPGARGLEGMFRYDQRSYLPALLQRQDRMSMAAGVEARVVFLSHPLVEWANRLPSGARVSAVGRKLPLRQLVARLLPEFPVDRPKVGFALPLRTWLSPGGGLWNRVEALQNPASRVGTWCDRGTLRRLVADQRAGRNRTDLLWTLLALEEWASAFLDPGAMPIELPGARSSLLSGTGATTRPAG